MVLIPIYSEHFIHRNVVNNIIPSYSIFNIFILCFIIIRYNLSE